MNNLAATYRYQERWTEVIEARKRVMGPEHPHTLNSMSNLAAAYGNQGRLMEAEKLEVQVIDARKKVLGPEHPSTLTSMWNLSHIWKRQGRDCDALAILEDHVQLRNQQPGLNLNQPDVATATAALKEWQAQVHRPSSPPSSSPAVEDMRPINLRVPHKHAMIKSRKLIIGAIK
jgi:hypothetical protein